MSSSPSAASAASKPLFGVVADSDKPPTDRNLQNLCEIAWFHGAVLKSLSSPHYAGARFWLVFDWIEEAIKVNIINAKN